LSSGSDSSKPLLSHEEEEEDSDWGVPGREARAPPAVFEDFYSSGEEADKDDEEPFADAVFPDCPPIDWKIDLPMERIMPPARISRRLAKAYAAQRLVAKLFPAE
jgi:hypothetical protein